MYTSNLPSICEDIEMQPMNDKDVTSPCLPASEISHKPPDCCPMMLSKHFSCCVKCIPKSIQAQWIYIRTQAYRIVEHRYFELIIIGSILVSSATLVS